ncbi:MAG: SRPBCC family protein [Aureispira sp.]
MKFHIETVVDIPFATLIELFENPENLHRWQPSVISFKLLSGVIGQEGAVSELYYDMMVKKITMKETIIKRDLPDLFILRYDADGVSNTVTNNFKQIAENKTRWIMQNNFKFAGIMKYAAMPLKGVFKKQTELTMERFKKFAEQISNEEQA